MQRQDMEKRLLEHGFTQELLNKLSYSTLLSLCSDLE